MQNEIEIRLGQFQDAYLQKSLAEVKAVKTVSIEKNRINIEIVLGYPHQGVQHHLIQALTDWVAPAAQGKTVHVVLSAKIEAHSGKIGKPGLPQVKNIIAVGSGKGGVGKSTVAVNLALALAKEGANTGLLDADIYGPSQPLMLGTFNDTPVIKERKIQPLMKHGIQSISMGNLVDAHAALAWRGPMLGKALEQLMYDTQWNNLDYLIIDLPPGTGDVQLTLCQKIPVSGAVLVTTPQDVALSDVRRACEMFNKLHVPVLGFVENMSVYHCPHCGHEENIFGKGGAGKLAKEYQLTELGGIPLDSHIRETTDSGCPPVVKDPDSLNAKIFYELARKTAAKLALEMKDYSARFPKIVVQQSEKNN